MGIEMVNERRSFGSIKSTKYGRLEVSYRDPRNRKRVYVGNFTELAEAERALMRAEVSLVDSPPPTRKPVLLRDYLPTVVEQDVQQGLAEGTLRNNRTLDKWLVEGLGHLPVADLSVMVVKQWWLKLGEETGAVNRRNIYFRLKKVMAYAAEEGLYKGPELKIRGAGRDVAKPRPGWSREAFDAVVALMPEDLHAAAEVMYGAHLRINELAGLNRSDFNPKAGTLRIERQDSEIGGRHLAETKTHAKATLKLFPEALEALSAHVKAHPSIGGDTPLFVGPKGGRLRARYYRIQWNAACAALGIVNYHPHDTRHTSLSDFGDTPGVERLDLQRRGRHKDPSSSQRYTEHAGMRRDAAVVASYAARV